MEDQNIVGVTPTGAMLFDEPSAVEMRPFLASKSIAQIATALAAAGAELANPVKDKTARINSSKGNYAYNYADLATVLDTVRPVLGKHGIAILSFPETTGSGEAYMLRCVTTLLHKSGEWISLELVARIEEPRVQAIGSAITYLRRYGLQALVGVAAEDDDDGNQSEGNQAEIASKAKSSAPSNAAASKPASNGAPRTITKAQIDFAEKEMTKHGKSSDDVVAFVNHTAMPADRQIANLAQIPMGIFDQVLAFIRRKPETETEGVE